MRHSPILSVSESWSRRDLSTRGLCPAIGLWSVWDDLRISF
jgi:hypothetical protein